MQHPTLLRRLTTTDAVIIGLGSMIGAGVFAAFGPAAQAAGVGLLIGLVLAAFIAILELDGGVPCKHPNFPGIVVLFGEVRAPLGVVPSPLDGPGIRFHSGLCDTAALHLHAGAEPCVITGRAKPDAGPALCLCLISPWPQGIMEGAKRSPSCVQVAQLRKDTRRKRLPLDATRDRDRHDAIPRALSAAKSANTHGRSTPLSAAHRASTSGATCT